MSHHNRCTPCAQTGCVKALIATSCAQAVQNDASLVCDLPHPADVGHQRLQQSATLLQWAVNSISRFELKYNICVLRYYHSSGSAHHTGKPERYINVQSQARSPASFSIPRRYSCCRQYTRTAGIECVGVVITELQEQH